MEPSYLQEGHMEVSKPPGASSKLICTALEQHKFVFPCMHVYNYIQYLNATILLHIHTCC